MVAIAQILVAAGKGARAGGEIPKQYRLLGGRTVLRRTLEATVSHPDISQTVVVIAETDASARNEIGDLPNVTTVSGGATRTASVIAGLQTLKDSQPEWVLIHDAARPFVTHKLMSDIIGALKTAEASVPTLPLIDAVKAYDGQIGADIERESLRRVQTPQGFHFIKILQAIENISQKVFADDIAIAREAGLTIANVPGDPKNIKLTYVEDFEAAKQMIGEANYIATGSGFDVHRVTSGDSLWLCGVKISAGFSLLGHSDADVGLHALTDAILGALADGDIGDHFPPSEEKWKDAPSDKFLTFAADRVHHRGGTIEHIDVTVICEKPKVKPHREAMRARIAELLGLPETRVSVKATTTEKLGFTGRGEGIAAQATATLKLPA